MNRAARHTPKGPWARIGRLGGYYNLKYYTGFDELVANTEDIAEWIVGQGWPAGRVRCIPNFAAAAPRTEAVDRASLETPADARLLLSMGRLHEAKAHDVTLQALTEVPDAWLWIAGVGPLEAKLKAMAQALGVADRVRFLGWRTDASALYRTADLCVFPSRYEPLGNVVIQRAHALPVVAAASQGPQALIEDGKDGLLVPVDDAPGAGGRHPPAAGLAGAAPAVRHAGAGPGGGGVLRDRRGRPMEGALRRLRGDLNVRHRGQIGGADARVPAMIEALTHRGPDGVRIEAVAGAAFAHARLSIIDLEGGWQPLHAAGLDGDRQRRDLQLRRVDGRVRPGGPAGDGLGLRAAAAPSTPTRASGRSRALGHVRLLPAWAPTGATGWRATSFGIKPLYLMEHDGGLAFASEPRAFFHAGLARPELDEAAARELLAFNYALAPPSRASDASNRAKSSRSATAAWRRAKEEPHCP